MLALAVLVINVAGLVALSIRGEASGHDILAIVGVGDATVGVIALVRALSVVRHPHPGRSLGGSAVALGLVTLLFLLWPDPIFAAARVVSPSGGQSVGEGFIAVLAVSWAILTGVAIASLLRTEPRRSTWAAGAPARNGPDIPVRTGGPVRPAVGRSTTADGSSD